LAASLPVKFVNSSLHTRVPAGIRRENAREETALLFPPLRTPIAFTVMLDETRNGAKYRVELLVGTLPSVL
jgi:hypothetical protein